MATNRIENYLAQLTIRRTARRRDTKISGGIFAVFFLAMIVLAVRGQLLGSLVHLVPALVAIFGFAYLTTWVKFQIINGSIELIENLYGMEEDQEDG